MPTARGLGFDVDQEGAGKAALDLERIGRRARDVRGVSYKVRTVFRQAEERRFAYQGPGWPPLADATRERKERQGLDPRIMRAKEVLYRSLTAPQAALQVDRRAPSEFEFGTEVPYARYHQGGRRKLIDLTPAERRQIDDAIGDFVAKGETR